MKRLLNLLFGCSHPSYSWPLSRRNGKSCKPYVCCLACGREFSFNAELFTVGAELGVIRHQRIEDIAGNKQLEFTA